MTRFGLPQRVINDAFVARPPLDEQRTIARFLDAKTTQIDALIAKKVALLAALAEQRTALISHAVTRGLDPAAPMKDSGVAWLGEIPTGWTLAPIKYFATCFNGSTPSTIDPEYWTNGTIPWLSSGKVNEDTVTQPSEWISERALKECSLRIVPRGSVVVGMIGQGRTRGLSAYLGISTTINQNMAAIVPSNKMSGRFIHFFFQQIYTQIRQLGRGANQPALDVGLISNILIAVPPLEEQFQIVEMLEQNEASFNNTTQKIQQAIDALREYRTALITNAVTGKIDVRGVAVR